MHKRQVVGGVVGTDAAGILPERYIQDPMHGIFNASALPQQRRGI